jgi:hypothetical protein
MFPSTPVRKISRAHDKRAGLHKLTISGGNPRPDGRARTPPLSRSKPAPSDRVTKTQRTNEACPESLGPRG